MAGQKKLINSTGNDLRVTLVVRKGDHPEKTAGTVDVELGAAPDTEDGEDTSVQDVTYGNDVDIYLNGVEVTMISNGSAIGERRIVATRGSDLDNALNTNDTLHFLYDGKAILISGTNSSYRPHSFAASGGGDSRPDASGTAKPNS